MLEAGARDRAERGDAHTNVKIQDAMPMSKYVVHFRDVPSNFGEE